MTTLLKLASEVAQPGEVWVQSHAPGVCAAMAPGDASLRAKKAPNEDSLAVVHSEGGALWALVADAHFGPSAGELAARAFARAAERCAEPSPAALLRALVACDTEIFQKRPDGDDSETTALALLLAGETLHWAGVGDSLLYRLRAGAVQPLNVPFGLFLGSPSVHWARRPRPGLRPEDVLDQGSVPVAPGDLFVLASDGIEEDSSGQSVEQWSELLAGAAPLEERVRALCRSLGTRAGGGGGDNLSVVVLAR